MLKLDDVWININDVFLFNYFIHSSMLTDLMILQPRKHAAIIMTA